MANVFKIGEDWDMVPPPPGFPKCGNYNGKGLFSFSPPVDFESPHKNIHEYSHSGLDSENNFNTHTNMISTIDKWWPFVGGAHPYVSTASSNIKPYFSILSCLIICLLFIK